MDDPRNIYTGGGEYRENHIGEKAQYAEGNIYNIFLGQDPDLKTPNQVKEFLRQWLENPSIGKHPLKFIRLSILLIQVFLYLILIFLLVENIPFLIVWELFKAVWNGKLIEKISDLQFENDLEVYSFAKGSKSFSIEEKIILEAKLDICFDLIQCISSNNPSAKDKIASILSENLLKTSWFSEKIQADKKRKYENLYIIQKQGKALRSTKVIQNYLNSVITLLESSNPSDDVLYILLEKTDDFIRNQPRSVSLQELSTIKSTRRLIDLISRKFVIDPSGKNNRLQQRLNQLLQDLENTQNDYELECRKNLDLDRKVQKLEQGIEKINRENLEEINNLSKKIGQLEFKNRELDETIINLERDPLVYLFNQWNIVFISKSGSQYHYHPDCHHWNGFAYQYIRAKNTKFR